MHLERIWCFDMMKIFAGVAQLVERQPSKLNVAGSNPVSRSETLSSRLLFERIWPNKRLAFRI